jgi:PqqD family protein of HPr-rel-A system
MKPRARADLAVEELEGELLVYDEETSDFHHLNPTASIVFSLCDGTTTVKEMAADIAAAFGEQPQEVERQVRALIRDLRRVRLLDDPRSRRNP